MSAVEQLLAQLRAEAETQVADGLMLSGPTAETTTAGREAVRPQRSRPP